jgi:hypothetical protein
MIAVLLIGMLAADNSGAMADSPKADGVKGTTFSTDGIQRAVFLQIHSHFVSQRARPA